MTSRKYINIISHILLWALVAHVFIGQLPLMLNVPLPVEYWWKQPTVYVILIILYYLNIHVFVPRLLYRQKLFQFILLHVLIIIALQVGTHIAEGFIGLRLKMLMAINSGFKCEFPISFEKWGLLDDGLLLTSSVLTGISTSSAMVNLWQKDLLKTEQQKQQQVNSELSFLKAQMHPHFFFNTLNNIYSLTYSNIETSRESLHKLSRMMRYMLYETEADRTMLGKEISFIKDYIQLMQLRMSDMTTVQFHAPANLEDKPITPMILLPFVENAFKHGVSNIHHGHITVRVEQEGNKLILEVENNLYAERAAPLEEGGIGLTNTLRRLQLIYGDRYSLTSGPAADNKYRVRLELLL